MAELTRGHIVNGLARHGLREVNGGAVMGVTVEHGLVDDRHDSLVHDWHDGLVVHDRHDGLVVHDSLVVHGHDVADDLVVDDIVVRVGLMHDGGVVVDWLVAGVVMHWLLVELAAVVGVRALVVLHLVVCVGRLVVRMVRLVFGLMGPERAVLGVSVPSMVIAIVVAMMAVSVVVITVMAISVSVAVMAISVGGGLVIVMETGITVVWLAAILRVLVVLRLGVGLVVVVLSFEILLFDLLMWLLVVGVMVDMLTDWLGVLGGDQSRMASVKVHLRVGVFWLEVVIDFPSLVVSRHNPDMVTAIAIDRLEVVISCVMPCVMRHFMVDTAVVALTVVSVSVSSIGLSKVGFSVMVATLIVARLLTVNSLDSVLVLVVMRVWVFAVLVVGLVGDWVVLRVRLVVPVHLLIVVVPALPRLFKWLLNVVVCVLSGRDCGNNGDSERSHLLSIDF